MKVSIQQSKKAMQHCLAQAGIILTSVILLAFVFRETPGYFLLLFLGGWLAWTFTEYCIHRFLMHELLVPGKKENLFNHRKHHQHPHDLVVKPAHRLGIFIVCVGIITLAIQLNNFFTVVAGFFMGFLLYNFLHYLLHQPYCKYIFPKIQRAHILHHTCFPNCGYSFSTILWDWLFNTLPPADVEVTQQMRRNFFGNS